MSIVDSEEFLTLRAQLKEFYSNGHTGGDWDVFVISRFDEDDETLRPYLSTAYSDHFDPTLYTAVLQQRGKGGVWRGADDQGGGHAEEKFIRSLNELVELFHRQPRLIEVYVSRIPCGKRSSPWQAHKPFEPVDMLWPEGCGPKLYLAMEATPHIKWELLYEENYGNERSQAESTVHIVRMNDLPNVRAGQWLSS